MDFNIAQVVDIEKVAAKADGEIRTFGALKISLVGGGCGEVVWG